MASKTLKAAKQMSIKLEPNSKVRKEKVGEGHRYLDALRRGETII